VLHVAVYGHEDLTQTVVVQPGGGFPFPLVGAVPAAGATTEELEARIARQLARGFVRDAQVSVSVREYRSQVVFVVGDVARPGTYPLAGETRIVEILSRAGPLSPSAGSEVLIVRPVEDTGRPVLPSEAAKRPAGAVGTANTGAARVLRVDVRAIQAGRLDQNLALQPNDTVFVPPAEQVFVTGEVRNPGAFPFREGITARQAVALAGGFTDDASTGGARVVREVGGRSKTLKIKLDERLRPRDTLVIKAAWF
jgi:polysaccharide export outer membrane protein